jgi:hypothetical protein
VADGGGLENRYGVTPIKGSNPLPSANVMSRPVVDNFAETSMARPASSKPAAVPGTQPVMLFPGQMFLYIWPSFMTNRTSWVRVMSCDGSPGTAMMSAR